MDHMFAQLNLSSRSKSTKSEEEGRAPIELLSKFLLAVQDRHMKEAQGMLKELLEFEPDNKMLTEYKKYIAEYIAQGLDEDEGKEDEESESEEEEEEADDNDSESEDEDEGGEAKGTKR